LYKTGDLVRYLPDGNIEFVGRMDNQIKMRGFRIELGEIENIIVRHPGVREAVVLVRENNPGDKRLVAYIVPRPKLDLTTSKLRSYLKDQLPEYMVPSVFVLLDHLPLTPNGKIDRKALPIPDQNRSAIVESYQSPRTIMEESLASIWAEVLGVKKVGIHDNFFDLGGHSLLAVRVVNLIKKRIGRTVRIASIFQAPTVERMTSVLHDHESTTPYSSLVPLQTKGSKPAFFWVHGEGSDAYLPRYLDSEQRLYGLQHQSTDGQPALYRTVEGIATHYLKEIYTVQPHGPYRLGGNCFGGLVAFEMANQLLKEVKKVDLFVLLNPASRKTGTSKVVSPPIWTKVNDQRHLLQLISSFRSGSHWNDVLNRVKGRMSGHMLNLVGSVKRATQKTICTIYECLGVSIPVSLRSRYILEIYAQALQYYVARPFQGDMVVFLGQDFPRQLRVNWSKQCTGSVTIHDVPGDHAGVLEDRNVKVWAVKLAACLEALELEQRDVERAVRAFRFH
jgi:thioesterase domain-containing protein/acyl carrier protein